MELWKFPRPLRGRARPHIPPVPDPAGPAQYLRGTYAGVPDGCTAQCCVLRTVPGVGRDSRGCSGPKDFDSRLLGGFYGGNTLPEHMHARCGWHLHSQARELLGSFDRR